MTDTIAPATPAGWYDDPADPSRGYRWWSGAEWTQHTSPKQAAPAQFAPVVPAASASAPYGNPEAYLSFSRDPALRANSYATLPATAVTGSSQTAGVWLLAALPAVNLIIAGILLAVYAAGGPLLPGVVTYPVIVGLSWWFAVLDHRELARRGYRPPSILWNLLFPPLGYLIARGRVLRKQGATVWPAEVTFVVLWIVLVPLALMGAAIALGGLGSYAGGPYVQQTTTGGVYGGYIGTFDVGETPTRPAVAAMVAGAYALQGVVVDCSGSSPIALGSDVGCVTPSTFYAVHICECGDVYATSTPIGDGSPAGEYVEGEHGVGNGTVMAQDEDAGSIPDERDPWEPQIEQSLAQWGGFESVDCSASAALIDKSSTFSCLAQDSHGRYTLSVTITDIGNIGFTRTADDSV